MTEQSEFWNVSSGAMALVSNEINTVPWPMGTSSQGFRPWATVTGDPTSREAELENVRFSTCVVLSAATGVAPNCVRLPMGTVISASTRAT